MSDVDEFLSAGAPAFKFATVGTTLRGTVLSSALRQKQEFGTGKPMVWDDGDPQMQIIITLATDERDPNVVGDDGERRIFGGPKMQEALKLALKTAKSKLEVGGTLVVKYSADGKPAQSGFNPPKLFEAAYRPPATTLDDPFAGPAEKGDQPSAADLL